MAFCNKCGNYDDSHLLECGIEEKKYEQTEDYQPDLYYYWDSPIVDLNVREMEAIIDALQFQMVESDSLNDFDDVTNEQVGFKLSQIMSKVEKARKKQPEMEW
jgi:hypothetical protein